MHTQGRNLAFGLVVLLLVFAGGCSFNVSTANIGSLKLGKDKAVSQETSSFGANDTVYAVATVDNVPSAVKVTGRLVIEDVEGEQSGPVPGLEKTLELPSSGTATYTFAPPPDGFPPGKYKVEVLMMNEAGEQKDQKSASFTVS